MIEVAAALLVLVFIVAVTALVASHGKRLVVDFSEASWNKSTPLVIVSSHFSENLSWLQEATSPVVICSKKLESINCSRLPNKGMDASAYLQFIIQNYDNLPQRMAFIHGHEASWHQGRPNMLEAIKKAKDSPCGFVTLNNHWIDDRSMNNENMKHLHAKWDEIFRPFLKRDPPPKLLHDCCCQFVVSRNIVLRHPKAAYEHWLEYLMREDTKTSIWVFEYLWHVIFGEPDIVTQEQHLKACW